MVTSTTGRQKSLKKTKRGGISPAARARKHENFKVIMTNKKDKNKKKKNQPPLTKGK
jgi:hypothetical protein